MFIRGRAYRRRELHRLHGGQRQGGIGTPTSRPLILVPTGEIGAQFGYEDGWTEDGLFFDPGESQQGNITFIWGNCSIAQLTLMTPPTSGSTSVRSKPQTGRSTRWCMSCMD